MMSSREYVRMREQQVKGISEENGKVLLGEVDTDVAQIAVIGDQPDDFVIIPTGGDGSFKVFGYRGNNTFSKIVIEIND